MEDARNRLADDHPFSFQARKDGSWQISWNNRPVVVLTGSDAKRLAILANSGDDYRIQLFLAKHTGNFKRGNEKGRG